MTRWDRFDRIGTAAEICGAHFDGLGELYLLFSRRFFDSDSDWETAQRIFRSTAGHREHQQERLLARRLGSRRGQSSRRHYQPFQPFDLLVKLLILLNQGFSHGLLL